MDVQIIVAIISSTVAIVTLLITSIYRYLELKEVRNAERRKEINSKLNDFYGPIISYLNVVKALYKLFFSNKPQNFRTLTYLLDPNQEYQTDKGIVKVKLSEVDKKLLSEIIETERKIEDLILTKSGLIDDDKLTFGHMSSKAVSSQTINDTSLIATVLSHFRLLRMAYNNEIKGDIEKFKGFVYPRQFDIEIKKKIDDLRNELKILDNNKIVDFIHEFFKN
ncbi:hypothetical protein KJ742_03185 [Patescibacteria group bacterium]|nr:hypothetical protein [Patescibacteria group bacterium]